MEQLACFDADRAPSSQSSTRFQSFKLEHVSQLLEDTLVHQNEKTVANNTKDCFSSDDAISVLIRYGVCNNTKDAQTICEMLLRDGCIRSIFAEQQACSAGQPTWFQFVRGPPHLPVNLVSGTLSDAESQCFSDQELEDPTSVLDQAPVQPLPNGMLLPSQSHMAAIADRAVNPERRRSILLKESPAEQQLPSWLVVTVHSAHFQSCAFDVDAFAVVYAFQSRTRKRRYLGRTPIIYGSISPAWEADIGCYVKETDATAILVEVWHRKESDKYYLGHVALKPWAHKGELRWYELQGPTRRKMSTFSSGKILIGFRQTGGDEEITIAAQPSVRLSRLTTVLRECTFFSSMAAVSSAYPFNAAVNYVVAGRELLRSIYAGERSQLEDASEVCKISWYIFAKVVEKNAAFISGAVLLEDPGFRLFNALSPLGYSRAFKGTNRDVAEYSVSTFGSSHFVDYIRFSMKRGAWYMPQNNVVYRLSGDSSSLGYYQVGIDINARPLSPYELGLFCGKSHILFGKLPLKSESEQRDWLFFKPELFGTKTATDQLRHGIEYLKSRNQRPVSSEAQKACAAAMKEVGLLHQCASTRKEKIDKGYLEDFRNIVTLAYRTLGFKVLRTELTEEELLQRAAVLGISFMTNVVSSILSKLAERSTKQNETIFWRPPATDKDSLIINTVLKLGVSFQERICCSELNLDHLEVRFGHEVILDLQEITSDIGVNKSISRAK